MPVEKSIDIICLGRLSVDMYAQQVGSRLEDVASFAKYLGGSSANIAVGASRMGLKSSLLSRVGDEHMGRFLREKLQQEGVDTSCLKTDEERLTALVILGIKDKETFPLIFYRENCADMAVSPDDFDEAYIASAKAFLMTGTHLSTPTVLKTAKTALAYAKKNNTLKCLDIDYRPVLWGLTGRGEGEERFVADETVTRNLQSMLPEFDLIVGTEEEIHIAGGSTDTIAALKNIHSITDATIVVKRGPLGACVIEGEVPYSLDDAVNVQGVQVEVMNVLGAGDAFMSGFLKGWINKEPYEACLTYANACGALVVSRHGCAPAMPTLEELNNYIARSDEVAYPDRDDTLNYLHRVTAPRPEWGSLCILAFDHRKQFLDMAIECGASEKRIPQLKGLLLKAMRFSADDIQLPTNCRGILADDIYGQDVLNEITGQKNWVARPVEKPSSRPLAFDYGSPDIGSHLKTWPLEQIVKCLVFYHPDDEAEMLAEQERTIQSLYNACCVSGHQLLLEIIPPANSPQDEMTVYRAIKRFYDIGVYADWWKISPQTHAGWQAISALIEERAPHCEGIVMLGLDRPVDELRQGFKVAKQYPIVKGFAVGRTIFGEPSRRWFSNEIDDQQLIDQVSDNYKELVGYWQQA
ncbi:5-dehydro-2-deoxygluconokinase [Leucothrix sargassi]|nr:5-dehydro-2-deoxygluconokinase [Leucothrix sargassi]